jgi:outer membrane protein assembly factor BamB
MQPHVLIIPTICLLFSVTPALALDWPQWRGPDRDGVSKEKGLLKEWPKDGPPLAWIFEDTGLGFSGPAIVGDRLYIMGARKDKTQVFALDISGKPKELWACDVGKVFTYQFWGDGPRSTPTVDGDHLYALGGYGDLVCVQVKNGKEVWRKNLEKDMNGEMMSEWGYSESVFIDGDALICTPGGPKGTVAALDKKTGKELWRSTDLTDKATYASIMAAEIQGVRQYVVMTYIDKVKGGAVAGVAAKDGKLLWYIPHFTGHSYATASTPIIKGNEVYITAGYGAGCMLLEIGKNGNNFTVKNLYPKTVKKYMKNQHGGVVLIGDHIYGHNETRGWVCQDWKSGKQEWEERNKLECTSGSIVAADGYLYLYSDEGESVLLQASPEGWIEKGRFVNTKKSQVPQNVATSQAAKLWTHPVIANGKLYLRDQEFLFCYDIREKK